jgi:hypothetical protein
MPKKPLRLTWEYNDSRGLRGWSDSNHSMRHDDLFDFRGAISNAVPPPNVTAGESCLRINLSPGKIRTG